MSEKNTQQSTNEISVTAEEQLSAWIDGELEADAGKFLQRRVQNSAELADKWSRYHLIGDVMRHQADDALAPSDFSANIMAAIANEVQEPVVADTQPSVKTVPAQAAVNQAAVAHAETKAANSNWGGWGAAAAMLAVVAVGAFFVVPELNMDNANNELTLAQSTAVDSQTGSVLLVAGTNAAGTNATVGTDNAESTATANALVRPAIGTTTQVSTGSEQNSIEQSNASAGSAAMPNYLNGMMVQHFENAETNQRQAWLPYVRLLQSDEQGDQDF